ncbi:L-lactate dehydrogenase [Pilibacter termitis]|uniref:L-lactate dehydrogenase n=1 Tax=Pilibacter termitis TaxID=263852 RepID=A0A1T4P101_9ENTE|nr:NAD(P)-binding domain-containing protein [Pilibacter termitis]SJZ84926.1 L-lactate dehydrogenase [Pilibacter termitis]
MKKIGIIGIGNVGATLAYRLVLQSICQEIVLIDENERRTLSETLDLTDAQVPLSKKTKIFTQDYEQLVDADLLIISLGKIEVLLEKNVDRTSELRQTHKMIEKIAPKIKHSGFRGIILVITNPNDVITTYLQKLLDYPTEKIFGSGCVIDSNRLKNIIAEDLGVQSREVSALMLGEHGESQFPAWSQILLKGRKISELYPEKLTDYETATKARGWRILTGKHYTSYGIATTASYLIEVLNSTKEVIVPVSNYDKKMECYYSYPCRLSRNGVGERVKLQLTSKENKRLSQSISVIQKGGFMIERWNSKGENN